MNLSKSELREIVEEAIFGSQSPTHFSNLIREVEKILARNAGVRHCHLEPSESVLANEIFWDLICERVITPGSDAANPHLPRFRIHSEAKQKREKK
jgi:hypothetical protein